MLLRPLLTLVAGAWLAAATSKDRNPLQSLGRIDDPIIQTTTHRVNSLSRFHLDFDLRDTDRRIRLALEPNHEVIGEGTLFTSLNPDGSVKESKPVQRHEYKIYKGTARAERRDGSWRDVGTARISLRRDGSSPLFEGHFAVDGDYHHVVLKSSYLRTKQELDPGIESGGGEYMLFFKDSDIKKNARQDSDLHTELKRDAGGNTCYADQVSSHWNPLTGYFSEESIMSGDYFATMAKRQIDSQPGGGNTGGVDLSQTIGQTAGCPTTRKVALVGVAADCGYTSMHGSEQELRQNIIKVMNQASDAFESSFNISLGIKQITSMDSNCPGSQQAATPWNQACSADLDIQKRLDLFSTWRNTLDDKNSHWTLLTSCNSGTAVGLAWVGSACTPPSSGSAASSQGGQTLAGANVVALSGGTEWQVIAHETGHTFGAVHDCDSQTCQDQQFVASGQCCPYRQDTCDAQSQFIMNPFTTNGIDHFSPCSIGNVCSAIGRNVVNTQCLSDNRAVQTITGQQCGNGIVEEGEDCDCGDSCGDDPCCTSNCTFASGAVCDDSNEDCCQGCQFSNSDTVCRASTSSCDPQEVCPGDGPLCPADVTAPDGQDCSLDDAPAHSGQLTCASGQCTSRNLQCMSVMGTYTNGNNDTYACDDSSCTMRCGSPAFGSNVCYEMQQNLLDGTDCGGGGHCSSGTCQGSEMGEEIKNWIDDHKGIVIGVATAVGVLLLIALLSCICGCAKRRRRNRGMQKLARGPPVDDSWHGPPPPVPQHFPQQQQYFAPPPMQQRSQPSSPGVWGHGAQEPGWRPSNPSSPAPQGQGLYGNGILGGPQQGYSQQGNEVRWPQPPPLSYWNGGGGSMRYA